MNYRVNRIAEEIKKIISDIINNELKDPRIAPLTSVTGVHVTRDMRYAKVYISVYGTDEEKKNTIDALNNAVGFMRKEVGNRIKTYYTPEIQIEYDSSIEKGMHISQVIEQLKKGANKNDGDE